jgi:hypothetical protein
VVVKIFAIPKLHAFACFPSAAVCKRNANAYWNDDGHDEKHISIYRGRKSPVKLGRIPLKLDPIYNMSTREQVLIEDTYYAFLTPYL